VTASVADLEGTEAASLPSRSATEDRTLLQLQTSLHTAADQIDYLLRLYVTFS